MIKKLIFCISFVLLTILPFSAFAVLIDFESFADRTNIAGVNLGGVTLTSPGNGNAINIFDNRFGVASHSGTKAIGNFTSGTPFSVPLIGVFDEAVSFISLWGGDGGGDKDAWTLNLFDAVIGGSLITSLTSTVTSGFPYQELAFSGSDIWRFEAIWTGPDCCGIGYDDLSFEIASVSIPVPSTILLISLGLVGLGFSKRRRV